MKSAFSGKKILILGLGLNQGGVGSAKFFAENGALVRITDLKSPKVLKPSLDQLKEFKNISYTIGEHRLEDIDWADLIIKNPAIKPSNEYLGYALKKGKQVEQDMGIFLQFVKPSKIIGVTGTKGKSTTASLIYEVLKNTKKDIILAGNIGTSVLDCLEKINPDTLIVLELSSFQLEAFEKHRVSPKWAVITNITPDHLNYYTTFEEYTGAKKIIGKYQTKDDFLYLRKDDSITTNIDFLERLNGNIVYFSKDDLPKDFHPSLQGYHNKENVAAAYALGKAFNIDAPGMLESLKNFRGVPFRMELVKTWNGIKIYNDTTATGPDAGVKALKTFPNCILIAGGMNKNMPYEEYAQTVDSLAKKVFFLTGDSTDLIKKLMKKQDLICDTFDNIYGLLVAVKKTVVPGDTILFSPAATSYNLFQNEFDRGRQFNKAVEEIFE